MPSGRGSGRFPPALPAGQGGEKGTKGPSPLSRGHHRENAGSTTSHQPGMDSPPKPPATVLWSFASATAPGPRRPAAPPPCRSSAGGQQGKDIPMGTQAAPTARPRRSPAFSAAPRGSSPSQGGWSAPRGFSSGGRWSWQLPKIQPWKPVLQWLGHILPAAAGPTPREHFLTSSWKRP